MGSSLAQRFVSALDASHVSFSQPATGAYWISFVDGEWLTHGGGVLSAYFHPSAAHSATTEGALGTKKSVAAAGTWAVSYQTRGRVGNKAFYNTN